MEYEVTITIDGVETTFNQDEILTPKFDCNCYFGLRPEDYVARIAEYGLTIAINNGDGTVTYRKISPHCMCEIVFTNTCNQP